MSVCPQPWTREQFQGTVERATSHRERSLQLVALLDEAHVAYAECGSPEVARRRGWILAELGKAPLEHCAWPVVMDTLQTAHEPYLLAAAARALRQAAQPQIGFGPGLLRAVDALCRRDDLVDLSRWGGVGDEEDGGTARSEALLTLQWMSDHLASQCEALATMAKTPGLPSEVRAVIEPVLRDATARADDGDRCCAWLPSARRQWVQHAGGRDIEQIRFQDHAGDEHSWRQQFTGQPTLLAFFYTRCDNPLKCSLTISKLAQVQRLLEASGQGELVRIAAVTYDHDFDSPVRMRNYARARGLRLGLHCRGLRVVQGADTLRRHLGSGVNFIGTLVNWHRIELFVLNANGHPAITYQRLDWDPDEVVDDLSALLAAPALVQETDSQAASSRAVFGMAPTLWAVGLALLPKCPICGATYLSVTGLAALPFMDGWLMAWPAALLLLLLNVGLLARLARGSGRRLPVVAAALGALAIAVPGLALGSEAGMFVGLLLVVIGSVSTVLQFAAQGMPVAHPTRLRTLLQRAWRALFDAGISRNGGVAQGDKSRRA